MCKIIFLSQEVVWVKPFRTEKVWRCEEHGKDFSTEGWRKRVPKICPTQRALDASPDTGQAQQTYKGLRQ